MKKGNQNHAWIQRVTGASRVERLERVQSLWSGYGEIVRYALEGAPCSTVILKDVSPPAGSGTAHARKLRSYAVERCWYERWAGRCSESCRVPNLIAAETRGNGWRILLEDLNAVGFLGRRRSVGEAETDLCLQWLASFHATFLGERPRGLWPTGTYWHLETRPDELRELRGAQEQEAAKLIDGRLTSCRYQTLVHGDAKLANFCFRPDSSAVAAVDFQYVGGGCGMKDVAYFLFARQGWGGSVENDREHLDAYFRHFRGALQGRHHELDADSVEQEWRSLFPFARADFYRFLAGWSPSPESARDFQRALDRLALERPSPRA